MKPRRSATDPGQATVEFALILPLFALLIVTLLDVTVIARDQLLADVLARDAARLASTATSSNQVSDTVAQVIAAAGRDDADWWVDIDEQTVSVQVELAPSASLLLSSTRWLGGPHRVVGRATFATEYTIDDQ
jgi:Flp pilus assembly protein TadG